MDVVMSAVIGVCLCASLSLLLFNCLRCHRKLTEEQLQQKYFEKFRKKHMKARDRVLTNRIDVIRSRTESQMSGISCDVDHTYQTIKSTCAQETASNDGVGNVDDHSFFDDSFQTVVEASSYNTTGLTDGKSNGNLLSASTNLASYISFQQQNRQSSSSAPILETSENHLSGEINPAFSEESIPSKINGHTVRPGSSTSEHNVIPNQGPEIRIIKPSMRKNFQKTQVVAGCECSPTPDIVSDCSLSARKLDCEKDSGSLKLRNDLIPGFQSDSFNKNELTDYPVVKLDHNGDANTKLPSQFMEKMKFEGKSHYDHQGHVNKHMKRSKGRTKLVIPSAALVSVDGLDEDHTYESITSVLTDGIDRQGSIDIVSENSRPRDWHQKLSDSDHTYESIVSKSCEDLINSITKSPTTELPAVHIEPFNENHETDKSLISSKKRSSDSDTAVVIIGRKVSWRYRPTLPSGYDNSSNTQTRLPDIYKSPSKSRRNSLERYSPFPSSKRLAFKSPFKLASSPRFPSMQVKSGNLKPTLYTELLNSASKSIGIENFNLDTPEMKVKDSPKVFTIDSTVYLSPLDPLDNASNVSARFKDNQVISFNSPQMYYCTPMNQRLTKDYGPIRKSLPSLPDDLDLVIEKHCSKEIHATSTPAVEGQSFDL